MKDFLYGAFAFVMFLLLFTMAVDQLCSTQGDYVGVTPTVIKK